MSLAHRMVFCILGVWHFVMTAGKISHPAIQHPSIHARVVVNSEYLSVAGIFCVPRN